MIGKKILWQCGDITWGKKKEKKKPLIILNLHVNLRSYILKIVRINEWQMDNLDRYQIIYRTQNIVTYCNF